MIMGPGGNPRGEIAKSLFQMGNFRLHSGQCSNFKIDCDLLTIQDIHTLARIIANEFNFGWVIGVPEGGYRIATALQKYTKIGNTNLLIVDDVLTTWNSMEEIRMKYLMDCGSDIIGVVIFARGICPDWITPIFRMMETV